LNHQSHRLIDINNGTQEKILYLNETADLKSQEITTDGHPTPTVSSIITECLIQMSFSSSQKKFFLFLHRCKGKGVHVIDRGGPWVYETSRLPEFLDNWLTDGGKVVTLTHRTPFTPPGRFLILISVRGKVTVRLKEFEPATSRVVTYCLNQLRYRVPVFLYQLNGLESIQLIGNSVSVVRMGRVYSSMVNDSGFKNRLNNITDQEGAYIGRVTVIKSQ
jgi:hypothetical protein